MSLGLKNFLLLYITIINAYNKINNQTITAMKRDSKPSFFIYREPGLLRTGVEELAEQALELCTEQGYWGKPYPVGCNGRARYRAGEWRVRPRFLH